MLAKVTERIASLALPVTTVPDAPDPMDPFEPITTTSPFTKPSPPALTVTLSIVVL